MPVNEHTIKVKKSFGRSAIMLIVIGVIAKMIGALYRVPLTNIVGAEGMGLYQMVFPVYTVLLAFCGGGVTGAMSRVVAKYTSSGNTYAAKRALKVCFVPLLFVSLALAAMMALLRNVISGVQGNTEASVCYLALAPSLVFAGAISVFRGYFQGKMIMLPSGISQLIEQIVKLALGLYLGKFFMRYGVKYAVMGALTGVSSGELVALVYLAIRYFVTDRKSKSVIKLAPVAAFETAAEHKIEHVSDRSIMKEVWGFALPVTLGSLVLPVTQLIDSALVINLLMYAGATRTDATSLFGLFVGPVGTLINLPNVAAVSVAVAFLPTLTAAIESGKDIAEKTRDAIKWIMLFVIPVTVVFMAFPERVVTSLYRRGLSQYQLEAAATLLRVQSATVFYGGVLQISTTVLQAHSKAHIPVVNLIIGACVKVALTPLLIRMLGVTGAAAATVACYGVAAALDVRSAYKVSGGFAAEPVRAVLIPAAFSLLGAAAFLGTTKLLEAFTPLNFLTVNIFGAVVFAAVYLAGALALSIGFDRLNKLGN